MVIIAGIVLIVVGVAVVIVAVVRGDTGFRRLKGEDPATRQAVRVAIRRGETTDPEVDRLAREVLASSPNMSWAKYFFGLLLMLNIVQLITGGHSAGGNAYSGASVVMWAIVLWGTIVNERRRKSYRGLTAGAGA